MADKPATFSLFRHQGNGFRFAPGHLGELSRYLPTELVDAILEEHRAVERRRRLLPSRVGVYFVLALSLFPSLGYLRVWNKLICGLAPDLRVAPSEKALRHLRRRIGPAPLKALFEVVSGPLAQPTTPGARYRGWRTVAFDGCSAIKVPDCERNRSWLGKIQARLGWAGYPLLRLMALCETGTRGLLGAAFGPTSDYETAYARQLLPLLDASMLLLADRGFDADDFLADAAATGAQFVIRVTARRRPAVLAVLPDGSYLTRLGKLKARIIDATITMTVDGQEIREHYRIATTLLDHRRDPAEVLVRLYHERWEVESAFYALRHTLQNGFVLRSQDRPGLEQEIWAQLTVYQVLRMAMVDAVESRPGTDPDRASFTIALETAREQVILAHAAAEVTGYGVLVGAIGRAILDGLLPPRRSRTSARVVKAARTKYSPRPDEPRPRQSHTITSLAVSVRAAPTVPPKLSGARTRDQREAVAGLRPMGAGNRNRTFHLMAAEPDRAWRPREVAIALGIHNHASFATQMNQWAAEGLLKKIAYGTYTLDALWKQGELTDPVEA